MSHPGLTTDSLKQPIVLLAFLDSSLLRLQGELPPSLVGLSQQEQDSIAMFTNTGADTRGLRVNCWDNIESFSYELAVNDGGPKQIARFSLFDPEFNRLIPFLAKARNQTAFSSVLFQWGWILDGAEPFLSAPHVGTVFTLEPSFLQEGCRINVEVITTDIELRTIEKATAWWPDQTPGHVVVKQAIELPFQKRSPLNAMGAPPTLEVRTECEPLYNNGAGFLLNNEAPLSWLRRVVFPKLRPKDPAKQSQVVRVVPNETHSGFFLGVDSDLRSPEIKRVYHVGRGQNANVISFSPTDNRKIGAQLYGGDGFMRAVDGREKKTLDAVARMPGVQDSPAKPASDEIVMSGGGVLKFDHPLSAAQKKSFEGWAKEFARTERDDITNTPPIFVRNSAAHSEPELGQERFARLALAQQMVNQADLQLIGDPGLTLSDLIEINVYMGGTIATAGLPSGELVRVAAFSGLYVVLGFNHTIEGGKYTTVLLVVSVGQAQGEEHAARLRKELQTGVDDANAPSPQRTGPSWIEDFGRRAAQQRHIE